MKLLLPWYANGTLNEHEMTVVSTHLQRCASCQHEVNTLVTQMSNLHEHNATALANLLNGRSENFSALMEQIKKPISQRNHLLSYSTMAAAAVIGLTLLAMTPIFDKPVNYRALTSAPTVFDGPVVQVIFHPHATEPDIRSFLLDTEAQQIGVPSSRGVYRMTFPNNSDHEHFVERLLHSHPAVRWAHLEQR